MNFTKARSGERRTADSNAQLAIAKEGTTDGAERNETEQANAISWVLPLREYPTVTE